MVPDPLQLLLDVQRHDIAADQLRHRRDTLPERQALVGHEATLAKLDATSAEVGERLAEVRRTQKRLEDEVASIEAKAAAENLRLYSGSITSPRELQSLQEEVDALNRRQRGLEDELLDVMEAAEPLAADLDRIDVEGAEATSAAGAARAAIAEAEAVIDGDLAAVAAERDGVVTHVPADLVATYEKLRTRLGGVAIARLEGGQCTGCHLSLPATEVDAVRRAAPGSFVLHEECGRILVRS